MSYQNVIREEIKGRLRLENDYCHAFEDLLSSHLLSINTKS
jgi:hypothetical protein